MDEFDKYYMVFEDVSLIGNYDLTLRKIVGGKKKGKGFSYRPKRQSLQVL